MTRATCWGWLLAALSLVGCGPRAEPLAPVLIVGADGLEWSVLEPLLDSGRLPNLRQLIDRGVAGRIATYGKREGGTLSPVIWTTIATGKSPLKHGITDFLSPRDGRPFTSNARRGKALWNIASDYGLDGLVVGWWITWPAEEIRGRMVSSTAATAQVGEIWKGSFLEGVEDQTYPAGLTEEIQPLVDEILGRRVHQEERLYALMPELPPGRSFDETISRLMRQTAWTLATDSFYARVACRLAAEQPVDLMMVYFGGTDAVGHRFWGYREPDSYAYPLPGAGLPGLEQAVDRYYEQFDVWLGQLLEVAGEGTTVIVVSDHGMHAAFREEAAPSGITGGHGDGPPGVLVAAGPGIAHRAAPAGERPILATIHDITPTVLWLLGVPVGRDMDGEPARKLVDPDLFESRPARWIATHDRGFRLPTSPRAERRLDEAFVRQFRDLGYFDHAPLEHFDLTPGGDPGDRRRR